MKTAKPATQCGLGFTGFIFVAFLLVLVSIVLIRLIPAYMQNAEIENIFVSIANDPEMQNAKLVDIRASFTKRASIDDVEAVKAEDIKIVSVDGKLVLSAEYEVKIPLAGNVNLYLDFKPTSAEQK